MDIVARAQGMILRPKEEWEKVKAESTTIQEIFTSYAVILAAIPALANFIGMGLIGRRIPFYGWFRYPIGRAFVYAILMYVFSLVAVYLLGIVINALAPTFTSKTDAVGAMKLAVFSMTPYWVASVLYIIPFLGFLVLFAGLYGLYVLYLGFATPMMDTPKEKVMGYLLVTIIAYVVIMAVVMLILGMFAAVGNVGRLY